MTVSPSRALSASKSGRVIAPHRRLFTVFAGVSLLASLLAVSLSTNPASAGPLPVMTGYVPLPADQFHTALVSANAAIASDLTIVFTAGITNAGSGAVITYDQWEDGYEADIANPVQSTTLVFGDSNTANGNAAAVASCGATCAGDTLPAGAVLLFQNQIPTPRVVANQLFDGRDKVASTRGFSLVAGGFPLTNGSVISGVVSSFDTTKYGLDYVVPVGENTFAALGPPAGTSNSMATASLIISAAEDGTVVNIDKDANGSFEQTVTLNQGEVVMADKGVLQGAHVTATRPVQVHLSTGDPATGFESRWFTLFPTPLLTSDYLSPVGSSVTNFRTILYVHNPGSTTITVTPTCTGCAGTLTVLAHQTQSFATPLSQAVRLQSSGGQPFIALGASGAQSGAAPGGGTDASGTWDSGFTLIPTSVLTSQAVLSWAPGNSAVPPSSQPGDFDDNPVWITTLTATTIYVDFDGNPATGAIAGAGTCAGENFDTSIAVAALASTRFFDATDGDMTGARIAACDGTKIAGAWGEDPSTAPNGSPGFDAGYTIIPTTVMVVDKTAAPAVDVNGDGRIGPGDTVTYDIAIADAGALSFSGVAVDDAIPAGTTYVPGSVTFVNGATVTPISDDVVPPALTAYPLDAGDGGSPIPNIAAGNTVHVRYEVSINDVLPPGQTTITNVINVVSSEATASDVLVTTLATSDLSLTKALTTTPAYLGQNAVYRVTLTNGGPDPAAGVEVTDAVPTGTTFVAATPSQGSYSSVTGVWSGISLGNGASATLDVTVTVNALTVDNFAQVTMSGSADPDSQPAENALGTGTPPDQDDEATVPLTVLPQADLSLAKTVQSGPDAGGNVAFRLTLANGGPSTATGISVVDYPPAGSTFVGSTPSTGTFTSGTNTWAVPSLVSGGSATLDVTYHVTTYPSTNYAQVTAVTEHDPDSNPDAPALSAGNVPDQDDEASIGIVGRPDLSLTKSAGSVSQAGDTVTYTVTLANTGLAAATGVVVTDLLPAGLAFTGATPTQGSYVANTGVWTVGTVNAAAGASLTITAVVTAPGTVTNTAEVTAQNEADFDSTPNNQNATEDDQASAGITVTGTSIGDRVWYDVNGNGVQEAGEPGIPGVSIGIRWAGPDGILNNGDDVLTATTTDSTGAWIAASLPSGSYSVTSSALPNGLTTPTYDLDGTGTAGTANFVLTGGTNRTDIDFGYRGSGTVGDTIFNDLNTSGAPNAGEGINGVSVNARWAGFDGILGNSDDIVYPTVTTSGGGVYSFGNLPAGQVAVTVATGTLPANVVPTVDPDGGTDSTSTVTLVTGQSRNDQDFGYVDGHVALSVTKSDGGASVTPGGVVTYTLNYGNGSGATQAATNVVLTETVPANVSFNAGASTAGWVCAPNGNAGSSCTLSVGTLGIGATGSATFAVTLTSSVPAGTTLITNTATIADDGTHGTDLTPGDNTGSDTTPVVAAPDLSVTKSDGGITTNPGGLVPYVLSYANTGNQGATGVVLTETVPTGTTFVAGPSTAGWSCTPDNSAGSACTLAIGAVAAGGSGTATFAVRVAFPFVTSSPLSNTASIADDGSNGTDPTPGNNTSSDTTPVAVGTLGDKVFLDSDNDASFDAGEGLAGVTVNVVWPGPDGTFGNGDDVTVTSITDATGTWTIGGLPIGSLRVDVVTAGLPAGLANSVDPDGGTANTSTVTLTAGATNLNQDFGYRGTGTIGDTVFSDTNGDGIQQPGEPGLGNVMVSIDNAGHTVTSSTTTTGAGTYHFTNLTPGTYTITVTPVSGQTPTTPTSFVITIPPGGTNDSADFGFVPPPPPATGTIGDTVFTDTNGNGAQDAGEPGLAGVTVTLRIDADNDGTFETVGATQVSGADGHYSFENLPPSPYQVVVTPPTGQFPTTPIAIPVQLGSGDSVLTADFGLRDTAAPTGSIGTTVFDDTNGNGTQDPGELGVAAVTLTLRQDTDGDGIAETVVGTTITDTNGAYSFPGLPPGSYTVTVTPPSGQFVTTAATQAVALSAGETVTTADFGLNSQSTPPPGVITGSVWSDTDRDEVFDSSEAGVNGATVTLRSDPDGDGVYDTVVATTTSAGNGDYSFTTVSPGRYRVVITPPAGQSVTTVSSYVVDMTTGGTVNNIDFGLATPGPMPFDLWVVKSLDGEAQQGQPATWLLVVGNNGIAASPNPVTLTDVLPAGLTYQSFTGTGWTCIAVGQTVTCSLAQSLVLGATAELRIVTLVGDGVTGQLVNQASVAANGVELTQSNNVGQGIAEVEGVTAAAPVPTSTTTTTTPENPLPATGSESFRTVLLGLVSIMAGAMLLAVRRRSIAGD